MVINSLIRIYESVGLFVKMCIWLSVYHLHVYELIYMATYVCSLVCKRIHVVRSKRRLICMHIYVIVYIWQGFMSWVHNHMVTPSILMSKSAHELCMKVCLVIILCTYASRYIRVCMYVHMFTNIEISKWLQGLGWLQYKKSDELWTSYGRLTCVRQVLLAREQVPEVGTLEDPDEGNE